MLTHIFSTSTFYFSTLDNNATNSTWDELIELMHLRFIAKRSYAGTCRLFRTFVGTYQQICFISLQSVLSFLSIIFEIHLLTLAKVPSSTYPGHQIFQFQLVKVGHHCQTLFYSPTTLHMLRTIHRILLSYHLLYQPELFTEII